MEVVVVGSAVVDILAGGMPQKADWQEKQRIKSIKMSLGGDALNQAVRLAQAGHSPRLVAKIGNDSNGKFMLSELSRQDVEVSKMAFSETKSTGTALVLVDENGERNIFSVDSAHSTLDINDIDGILSDDTRALSIASLFSLPVLEENGLTDLLRDAKSKGILTFADLASDKLNKGINGISEFLPYIDYFIPSIYDIQKMSGLKGAEENAVFLKEYGANNVIIKLGKDGAFALTDEFTGFVPALNVTPVDTTGAGDTFVAYFISALIEGENVENAARHACKMASLSTLQAGGSVPTDSGTHD